ncbi:hypothetical protein MMC11_001349 [Xylographa trunciseda]|nr:hypothetical protein [Xylographa trunciseda]
MILPIFGILSLSIVATALPRDPCSDYGVTCLDRELSGRGYDAYDPDLRKRKAIVHHLWLHARANPSDPSGPSDPSAQGASSNPGASTDPPAQDSPNESTAPVGNEDSGQDKWQTASGSRAGSLRGSLGRGSSRGGSLGRVAGSGAVRQSSNDDDSPSSSTYTLRKGSYKGDKANREKAAAQGNSAAELAAATREQAGRRITDAQLGDPSHKSFTETHLANRISSLKLNVAEEEKQKAAKAEQDKAAAAKMETVNKPETAADKLNEIARQRANNEAQSSSQSAKPLSGSAGRKERAKAKVAKVKAIFSPGSSSKDLPAVDKPVGQQEAGPSSGASKDDAAAKNKATDDANKDKGSLSRKVKAWFSPTSTTQGLPPIEEAGRSSDDSKEKEAATQKAAEEASGAAAGSNIKGKGKAVEEASDAAVGSNIKGKGKAKAAEEASGTVTGSDVKDKAKVDPVAEVKPKPRVLTKNKKGGSQLQAGPAAPGGGTVATDDKAANKHLPPGQSGASAPGPKAAKGKSTIAADLESKAKSGANVVAAAKGDPATAAGRKASIPAAGKGPAGMTSKSEALAKGVPGAADKKAGLTSAQPMPPKAVPEQKKTGVASKAQAVLGSKPALNVKPVAKPAAPAAAPKNKEVTKPAAAPKAVAAPKAGLKKGGLRRRVIPLPQRRRLMMERSVCPECMQASQPVGPGEWL